MEDIQRRTPCIAKHASKVASIVLLTTGSAVFAQDDIGTTSIGKMEFQKNCAACHGEGGKGDGPLIEF